MPDLRQKKLASWIAQCVGEGPRLGKFGQNKEGLESVPGGVQVQQPVHRTNNGKHLMGAACLNAVGIFLQQLVVPQPIKVPVQKPCVQPLRAEALVGSHIGKRQGQLAANRANTKVQQAFDDMHATQLITVRQRIDHDMWTSTWATKRVDVVHTRRALAVRRQVFWP